ncbi:hypothetical protein BC628DRAFT_1335602 [Trametes gibbosa]|nr:hypothetical protein BC628DRAFT_1335602 [Trametes gibbosa]
MCDEGNLDGAVQYLKSMPLDAQNTTVWNTIITQAGIAKRFRLAYDLYVDMKRRGFKTNLSTYGSLMAAFNKVDSWHNRSKLFCAVQNVYKHYLDYIATVKEHNPSSPEISVVPINIYITILSKNGNYSEAFDVYNALEEEGPLSPDLITYTTMLRTMYRRSLMVEDEEQVTNIRERCASDARLLWRQLTKRIEGGSDIGLDAIVISSVLQVLALGRPADHIIAFDIIRDYLGLAKPGETAPVAQVELSAPLVQDILWLCNKAQKYRLCLHFVQQLMDRRPGLLDRGHFDHVLTAYGSLSAMGSVTEASRALQTVEWMLEREKTDGPRIRPGLATYTLVLVVCWRAKDWETAIRTVELMTGLRAEDFSDEGTRLPARADSTNAPPANGNGKRVRFTPDAAAMSCLVRTALESGDEPSMRQCARVVHKLGLAQCLTPAPERAPPPAHGMRTGARFGRDHTFYAHKVAQAVVELVDVLVPKKKDGSPPLAAEERAWVAMRSDARTFLIEQREHRPRGTPQMEEQPLGSAAGLAAMDSVVEWDRISREQKSAR